MRFPVSFGALRPVSPMIFGRRREMDDGAVRRCGSRGFPRRVLWPSRPPPPAWRPSRAVAGADPGSARPPSRGEAHRASPPPAPARAHPSSGAFAGGGRRAAARSPWRGPGSSRGVSSFASGGRAGGSTAGVGATSARGRCRRLGANGAMETGAARDSISRSLRRVESAGPSGSLGRRPGLVKPLNSDVHRSTSSFPPMWPPSRARDLESIWRLGRAFFPTRKDPHASRAEEKRGHSLSILVNSLHDTNSKQSPRRISCGPVVVKKCERAGRPRARHAAPLQCKTWERSSPPRQSSPPRRRQWCCMYPSAPPSSCIPPSESDVP